MSPENKQFIQVVGLGIGEETKGATVQFLARELDAHTVLRSEGSQASRELHLEDGSVHMLRHFGSGVFEGSHTHLINMVIDPIALFAEAKELEDRGVENPLARITVDQDCLCVTPFQGAMSRLREILRGENKKGTIGKGVGEAVRDARQDYYAIRALDLFRGEELLHKKINAIRLLKLQEAQELISALGTDIPREALTELGHLQNEKLVESTTQAFSKITNVVGIVGKSYLRKLLDKQGSSVGEVSHGALLHPYYGFVPHVTQVDPFATRTWKDIKESGFDGAMHKIGVTRSYMTRHGAGPLVSYNPTLTQQIHEGPTNNNEVTNAWLGQFRNGHYDLVALNYAIEASGGVESYSGLAISFLDALSHFSKWGVCVAYNYTGDQANLHDYFHMDGNNITAIKVYNDETEKGQLEHQKELTRLLFQCQPIIRTITKPTNGSLEEVFLDTIEKGLHIPVVATAHGPMASQRSFRDEHATRFTLAS